MLTCKGLSEDFFLQEITSGSRLNSEMVPTSCGSMSTFFSSFPRVGKNSSLASDRERAAFGRHLGLFFWGGFLRNVASNGKHRLHVKRQAGPIARARRGGDEGSAAYLGGGVGGCLAQGQQDFEEGAGGGLAVAADGSAQLRHALLDVAPQGVLHNAVHLLGVGLKVAVDLKTEVKSDRHDPAGNDSSIQPSVFGVKAF